MKEKNLYHIHRKGYLDNLWCIGNTMKIGNNFESNLYNGIREEENILEKRYGNYDIDFIITTMEEMKSKNLVEEDMQDDFNNMLNRYYFLRKEIALEEGRKLFAPNAPSRLHSLFLTDKNNLLYWQKIVGDNSFEIFLLEVQGKMFVSSDNYSPNPKYMLDIQIEQSKEYWQPSIKKLTLHKEYLFQGKCKIIK